MSAGMPVLASVMKYPATATRTAATSATGQARPGRSERLIAFLRHSHTATPTSSAAPSQGSQAVNAYDGNTQGNAMPMLLSSTPPGRVTGLDDSGGTADRTAVYQKMICTASGVFLSSST